MKKLTFQSFGLTEKDVAAQKRIDPQVAMAILEGRVAGTERLDCYVYRIAPKPPFAPKGTPSYLCRLETPKTMDELKAEIGGGVFRFVGNSFSEKEEATGQRKTVVDFIFEIDGPALSDRLAIRPALRAVDVNPLAERPGSIGPPRPGQGDKVDEELAFLQKAKLYKEVFGGNGNGNGSSPEKILDVFLKGMAMQRDLLKDVEPKGTTGYDLFREMLQLLRQAPPVIRQPAAPSPSPRPVPREVHVEQPVVAVAGDATRSAAAPAFPNLDSLLEYVMDSFDEGKPAKKTAEEIVTGVPRVDLGNILSLPDENVVTMFENGSRQFEGDWLAEKAAEKHAWLLETVREARMLLRVP